MSDVTTGQRPLDDVTAPRPVIGLAMRYLLVGAGAFALDVALLYAFHDLLRLPLPVSTPLAFVLSFVVTYLLQRTLTFGTSSGVTASFLRYALLVLVNTLAVTAIVSGVVALGGPWLLGKVVAVVATTTWNFFAYRHWVFSTRPVSSPTPVESDA